MLSLLNPTGPGESMIQFCMASLLATLVLDDEAMELIKQRQEVRGAGGKGVGEGVGLGNWQG